MKPSCPRAEPWQEPVLHPEAVSTGMTSSWKLIGRGFELVATHGTANFLNGRGIACQPINKVIEGRPHIVDLIKNDEICFIVNTTEGRTAIRDSYSIRREALQRNISYSTTIAGGFDTLRALDHENDFAVHSLQQLHRGLDL